MSIPTRDEQARRTARSFAKSLGEGFAPIPSTLVSWHRAERGTPGCYYMHDAECTEAYFWHSLKNDAEQAVREWESDYGYWWPRACHYWPPYVPTEALGELAYFGA